MIVCAGATPEGKALAELVAGRLATAGVAADFDAAALADVLPGRWGEAGAFVLVCATGIAVRLAAPLLSTKDADPGIVILDDAGRFVVALSGGHEGGANALALRVGAMIGAEPVVTTVSEGAADHFVGLGCSTDATAEEIVSAVRAALPAVWSARLVATLDRKARQASVVEAAARLGVALRGYTAEELAAVDVPHPSPTVAAAVGTPSVAEAAALLSAGSGAVLETTKQVRPRVTVAVALASGPASGREGKLTVVGLGPGDPALLAPAARTAIRGADVVIGFSGYVESIRHLLRPRQDVRPSPIGAEVERAREALDLARSGRSVVLVSSGDPGVYAMASVALELAGTDVQVDVVPGISAAQAAAARLGAPLGHDFCCISLSDLLTPWSVIESRVEAAGAGDFVVAFYNPRSAGRGWQLDRSLDILRGHRKPETPAGLVTDAARPGETVVLTSLAALDTSGVGMTTVVIVGSTRTQVIAGRMVTPRGYSP